MTEKSMLAELLRKQADTQRAGEVSGKNVSAALAEVKRQITQCLTGGSITKGEGVTKSGKED